MCGNTSYLVDQDANLDDLYLDKKMMPSIGIALNAEFSLQTLSVKFCRDGLVAPGWEREGCCPHPLMLAITLGSPCEL